MLYGLGLATPIFFQLIIDKVLVHQSYSTLYVLALGISIALLFDAAFSLVRRYLLLYATNKIDIRTATRSFGRVAQFSHCVFSSRLLPACSLSTCSKQLAYASS